MNHIVILLAKFKKFISLHIVTIYLFFIASLFILIGFQIDKEAKRLAQKVEQLKFIQEKELKECSQFCYPFQYEIIESECYCAAETGWIKKND